MASLIHLILQLSLVALALGYGFQYSYDPATQYSTYWSHVPGSVPITHWDSKDPNWSAREGRNWNSANWNNGGNWNAANWNRANWNRANWNRADWNQQGDNWNRNNYYRSGDPNLKRVWDSQAGEYKWTCKTDAIYSEAEKQCIWNPGYAYSRF